MKDESVLLAEHQAAVGQPVQAVQVVGGQHDRLPGLGEFLDQLGQPFAGARVLAFEAITISVAASIVSQASSSALETTHPEE